MGRGGNLVEYAAGSRTTAGAVCDGTCEMGNGSGSLRNLATDYADFTDFHGCHLRILRNLWSEA